MGYLSEVETILGVPLEASFTVLYKMSQEECARLRGRVFLMLKYTDITQNTYVQS